MRLPILAILLATSAAAQAATTITVSPFDLFQGARKLGSYATAAECSAAAQQLIGRTPNAAFHSA